MSVCLSVCLSVFLTISYVLMILGRTFLSSRSPTANIQYWATNPTSKPPFEWRFAVGPIVAPFSYADRGFSLYIFYTELEVLKFFESNIVTIFLSVNYKHMFLMLKRTVLKIRFSLVPTIYV